MKPLQKWQTVLPDIGELRTRYPWNGLEDLKWNIYKNAKQAPNHLIFATLICLKEWTTSVW